MSAKTVDLQMTLALQKDHNLFVSVSVEMQAPARSPLCMQPWVWHVGQLTKKVTVKTEEMLVVPRNKGSFFPFPIPSPLC